MGCGILSAEKDTLIVSVCKVRQKAGYNSQLPLKEEMGHVLPACNGVFSLEMQTLEDPTPALGQHLSHLSSSLFSMSPTTDSLSALFYLLVLLVFVIFYLFSFPPNFLCSALSPLHHPTTILSPTFPPLLSILTLLCLSPCTY